MVSGRPDSAQAWRELRLQVRVWPGELRWSLAAFTTRLPPWSQWLRVQEALVMAEAEGIDSRVEALRKRSQMGHGGGVAVMRMVRRCARPSRCRHHEASRDICMLSLHPRRLRPPE